MKKSTKPSVREILNDSIFVQLVTSHRVILMINFLGYIYLFWSPEGDPLNKGENGKGSWNLWTAIFLWLLSLVLYFIKKRFLK
jgi:hypothetical protein